MNDETLKKMSRLVNPPFLKNSTIQKTVERMAAQQAAMENALLGTTFSSAKQIAETMAAIAPATKLMEDMAAQRAAMENALLGTTFSSAKQIAETMAAITPATKLMEDMVAQRAAMENALLGSSRAMESIFRHQASLDRLASSFYRVVGSVVHVEPEWLSEIANRVAEINLDDINTETIEDDLEAVVDQLDEMADRKGFFNAFPELPPVVRYILFFLLVHVILAQANSISANLITPAIESFLKSNNATDREKIREIKQIPRSLNDLNTDHLRFITGSNVRLRALPSTKSDILDELVLGQVVTVVSKERNWIEVSYEYESGEILSGWVFTRYTARFVK